MRIRLARIGLLSLLCFSATAASMADDAGYQAYVTPDPVRSNTVFAGRVKDKIIISGQRGAASACGLYINIHRLMFGEELRQEDLEQAMRTAAKVPAGTDSPGLHCENWDFPKALQFYDMFARSRAYTKLGLPQFAPDLEPLFGRPPSLQTGNTISTDSLIPEIDRALERGRLVVAQLHPAPLWEALEAGGRRCGAPCRLAPRLPARHPVVVLGKTSDPASGKTIRYWIGDSAPAGGAKYEVPAQALHKALWVAAPSFVAFTRDQVFPAVGSVGKEDLRPNDPGGDGADCTKGRKADPATMTELAKAYDAVSRLEVKNILAQRDPHQYLVFVVLDGTSNHRDLFVKDPNLFGARSVDACIEGLRNPATSDYPFTFSKFPTNPLILFHQAVMTAGSNVVPLYIEGVGADPNLRLNPTLSAALGDIPVVTETLTSLLNTVNSTQVGNYLDQGHGAGLPRQVDKAYAQIIDRLREIKAKDKEARFIFVTSGFSRGAAAARALHVKLTKEGIPLDKSNLPNSENEAGWLVKPGEVIIAASVLFDTVTTQYLNRMPPESFATPGSVYQLLHITAKNEYRDQFPLTPIRTGGRIHEIAVPGAHSDIGGSYDPQGISALTLLMAMDYLTKAGVPFNLSNLSYAYRPTIGKIYIHDSRWSPDVPFDTLLKRPRERIPTP